MLCNRRGVWMKRITPVNRWQRWDGSRWCQLNSSPVPNCMSSRIWDKTATVKLHDWKSRPIPFRHDIEVDWNLESLKVPIWSYCRYCTAMWLENLWKFLGSRWFNNFESMADTIFRVCGIIVFLNVVAVSAQMQWLIAFSPQVETIFWLRILWATG